LCRQVIDDKQTVQMVIGVFALCFVSWFNEIASMQIASLPLWPALGSEWHVPISLCGIAAIGALLWCGQHPDFVSEQILTWHQDWLNYNKVKKQAERAKDLTERIKTKGLW
jgi:hypothetical protein